MMLNGFLRSSSAPLLTLSALMVAAFAASVVGILIDARTITGVPAWLKPAKFAISIAIYTGTLAWMIRSISVRPDFIRAMAWIISVTLLVEIVLIDFQAARGVTSHFNGATPRDAAIFTVMGIAIGILWLASAGILAALFQQRFADPSWGWALRLGMLITLVGSALGGVMVGASSHTIGAPDGGPGFPGLGWSSIHGDLRIPHFFGLHGIQVIPALTWLFGRGRTSFVVIAALSYFVFVAILTWQALQGESVFHPDSRVLVAFGLWAVTTLVGLISI